MPHHQTATEWRRHVLNTWYIRALLGSTMNVSLEPMCCFYSGTRLLLQAQNTLKIHSSIYIVTPVPTRDIEELTLISAHHKEKMAAHDLGSKFHDLIYLWDRIVYIFLQFIMNLSAIHKLFFKTITMWTFWNIVFYKRPLIILCNIHR